MCRVWLKIVNLPGELVCKSGDNLELYVKLNHKSLIGISVLLVDGKQQVKFALNVDTNGVNLI
jgi:hypothetical protein